MRWSKPLAPIFTIALLAGTASGADAQSERSWLLELSAGAFQPLSPGLWTDSVKTEVVPRVYLLASGSWALVTGEDPAPDWDVFGYFISAAYRIAGGERLSLTVQAGAGGTTYELGATKNRYFAANGGLKAYWHLNPKVGLSLSALPTASFAKKEDFGSAETGSQVIWNLPVSGGVFFRF
jgi:hypothetical protein